MHGADMGHLLAAERFWSICFINLNLIPVKLVMCWDIILTWPSSVSGLDWQSKANKVHISQLLRAKVERIGHFTDLEGLSTACDMSTLSFKTTIAL